MAQPKNNSSDTRYDRVLLIALAEANVAFLLFVIVGAIITHEPDSVVHLITSLVFLGAVLIYLYAVGVWTHVVMGRHLKGVHDLERASAQNKERIRQLEAEVVALSACFSGPDQAPSHST